MIRFLISEMWSVCSNVLTGMMYNLSAKYFCRVTWEILTAQHKLSHHMEPGVAFHEEGRSQWSLSLSSQIFARPALLGWKMLQQEFQFWLPVHIIATFPGSRNVLYRGCCKDSDQIVNNNLRQISTYNFKKLRLDWIKSLRVFEGCEICLKVCVWWRLYHMVPTSNEWDMSCCLPTVPW